MYNCVLSICNISFVQIITGDVIKVRNKMKTHFLSLQNKSNAFFFKNVNVGILTQYTNTGHQG